MGVSIIMILGKIYVRLEIEMDTEFPLVWCDTD